MNWLEEVYENCVYGKYNGMSPKERESWELTCWQETFKELKSLGVSVDAEFVETGMYLSKEEIETVVNDLLDKLIEKKKTLGYVSYRHNFCGNCLNHLLVYWTT